jgi:hypothetical protein
MRRGGDRAADERARMVEEGVGVRRGRRERRQQERYGY